MDHLFQNVLSLLGRLIPLGLKSARKPIPKIPVPKLPPLRSWGFQPFRSIETVSRSPAAQARLVGWLDGSQPTVAISWVKMRF